jgi:hypothetical protein
VKVTPSSSISSSSSNIHIKTPVANSEFATFFKNVGMKTVDSGSGSGGESDTEAKRLRTI